MKPEFFVAAIALELLVTCAFAWSFIRCMGKELEELDGKHLLDGMAKTPSALASPVPTSAKEGSHGKES